MSMLMPTVLHSGDVIGYPITCFDVKTFDGPDLCACFRHKGVESSSMLISIELHTDVVIG